MTFFSFIMRKRGVIQVKCRYCGGEMHGLTCPICGHKQLKNVQCTVCYTTIFPGQEYCPKCGNPTIYRSKEEIKKITPDTIYHSEESHNYHTVSESYDYQKNAYQYGQQKTSQFSPKFKVKNKTTHSAKKIVPIFLIILSAILLVSFATMFIIFENMHFSQEVDYGNSELEDFSYRDTSQSEYNYNFNKESLAFVYHEQIYVSKYDGIYCYEKGQDEQKIIDELDCRYLYANNQGLYYVVDGDLKQYRNDESYVILNDVKKSYHLANHVIYENQQHELINYSLDDQSQRTIARDIDSYYVDDVNERVMVFFDGGRYVLYDLQGQMIRDDFQQYQYERESYFQNGDFINKDYQTIHRDDLRGHSQQVMSSGDDCYLFALVYEDDVPYLYVEDYEGDLSCLTVLDNELSSCQIHDDIEYFFVSGNQTIYYIYDEDYHRVYYIGNTDGQSALLQ